MNLLDQPLGQLARRIAGATRVFHDHQLDFCCGGKHSLRDAAAARGVDGTAVAARLQDLLDRAGPAGRDWGTATPAELIDHIVTRFHERHRDELPELIRLAEKVERVHGDRVDCPVGLAAHLDAMWRELENHMQKEEQVLFPLLAGGRGALAGGPIAVLRHEHDEHGEALQRIAELTHDITLPRGACNTWRALYLGLRTLREGLMEHIHLENNVLFEQATAGAPWPQA